MPHARISPLPRKRPGLLSVGISLLLLLATLRPVAADGSELHWITVPSDIDGSTYSRTITHNVNTSGCLPGTYNLLVFIKTNWSNASQVRVDWIRLNYVRLGGTYQQSRVDIAGLNPNTNWSPVLSANWAVTYQVDRTYNFDVDLLYVTSWHGQAEPIPIGPQPCRHIDRVLLTH